MLFYQVLDANDRSIGAYSNLDFALQSAQDMTYWHTGHYYRVKEIQVPEDVRLSEKNLHHTIN